MVSIRHFGPDPPAKIVVAVEKGQRQQATNEVTRFVESLLIVN